MTTDDKDKKEDFNEKDAVSIGCATLGGTDPDRPQKVNQDAFFTFDETLRMQDYSYKVVVAGVMDGHGLKGHIVTNYLKERIPYRFQQFVRIWNTSNQQQDIHNKGMSTNTAEGDSQSSICCLLPGSKDQDILSAFVDNLQRLGHYTEEEEVSLRSMTCIGMTSGQKKTSILVDEVITNLLRLTFVMAHLDACQDPSVPAGRSGTTCVVSAIVLQETAGVDGDAPDGSSRSSVNKVFTANVGDSRAILWTRRKKNQDTDGVSSVRALSTETTLTKQDSERQRIESTSTTDGEGGKIIGSNVFYGPVGIAMTRALGDAVMLRAGVVPVPQISVDNVSVTEDNILVLGTDGIFDVLSNETVIDHILQQQQQQQRDTDNGNERSIVLRKTSNDLVKLANEKWSNGLPMDVKSDDMTCVILQI